MMTVKEFEIGEHTYRAEKMNAFDQLDLARKLLPVVAATSDILVKVFRAMAGGEQQTAKDALQKLVEQRVETILEPITRTLSAMPQDDARFITNLCLSRVKRKVPPDDMWQPVLPRAGSLQFDDIDMTVVLQIVWQVVEQNVLSFSFARPVAST